MSTEDPLKINFPILRIEIAHKNGVYVSDPMQLRMDIWNKNIDVLKMTPEDEWRSPLSYKPALQYRCSDIIIELAPDEMDRFIRHDLSPLEFHMLRETFPYRDPDIYDLHDDFYHPRTGEALQPIHPSEGE